MMIFMMKGMNHGGHDKRRDHDMSGHQAAISSSDVDELHALRDQLALQLGRVDAQLEGRERTRSDGGREDRQGRKVRAEA